MVSIIISSLAFIITASISTPSLANPHICIIGGGITAASISHFLTNEPLTPTPVISVFEKSSKLGGRIASVTLQTKNGYITTEAGASIIAQANVLMLYFVEFLRLPRKFPSDRSMGLWNGEEFVVSMARNEGVWQKFKLAARYGLSLVKMRLFVADMLAQYKTIYPNDSLKSGWVGHYTVKQLFNDANDLYNLSQVSFREVVDLKFSKRLANELISAITRVNYGQDVAQMNGMSGAVALAGSGASLWAVEGGNVQVVEGLIERAGVQVYMNTSIEKVDMNNEAKQVYKISSSQKDWTCDAVVLAVPHELANLQLSNTLEREIDVGRVFHRTYSTFVRGFLNKKTFGNTPPDSILTTEGVQEPFKAIGMVWDGAATDEPHIFKVFSSDALTNESRKRIFERGEEVLASFPWLAYPDFSPPEKFPDFVTNSTRHTFVYTSPLESAGSAMEMSAVSGANAAAILKEALQLQSTVKTSGNLKEEL